MKNDSSNISERKIITDNVVYVKTNKTIDEWFEVLDKKGGKKLKHAEIFNLIAEIDGLKPLGQWNQNLLATSYEWSRGLKERGQKEDGFEISVSKTINVPVKILYGSWIEPAKRNKWLKEKINIRKSTENKSARITWADNETSLSVDFYPKEMEKSMVVVQHQKIKSAAISKKMKDFWIEKLETLKILLER